ncbi:MAG: Eco57I restriction-modification methylase domain-containing protein [Gammaproteobacteria bacterium]
MMVLDWRLQWRIINNAWPDGLTYTGSAKTGGGNEGDNMSVSSHSLYENLSHDRGNWSNEEELRVSWLRRLQDELNIAFHAEQDRNDASYNQVIIEFKSKGLFHGKTNSPAFQEAIFDRLGQYIPRRAEREGIPAEEYIGIAIDGDHIAFAFIKEGSIHHRNLLPFNEVSVNLVAQACRDAKRRAVTAENLVEDFGHNSRAGQSLMKALANKLEEHLNCKDRNKTRMLFEEWVSLFGQVADLSAAQRNAVNKQVALEFNNQKEIAKILFVIHTYNAFVMKMLAAEIVSEYGLTAYPDFCERLLGYDDNELLMHLNHDIEQGTLFSDARINGFVEEVIFSWYTEEDLTSTGGEMLLQGVREMLTQIALYRMDGLSAARSKDLLKAFYQSMVPETLRKALGEFYTPDWLVDISCDRASVKNWLNPRVLDPTCGSGSFLLEVTRRKRAAAEKSGLTEKETLEHILTTVWGFDLNPLAVQTARVNFLIAIADLVAAAQTEIEIPVMLADAVYSPAHITDSGDDLMEYHIGSDQSDLALLLPSSLVNDRDHMNRVFDVMEDVVDDENDYDEVERRMRSQGVVSKEEADAWRYSLETTYNQVLELHKQSWNGIWFRIVRNFFWSVAAGEFDLIVGNPPWVRWSNLPEKYRERIKDTCKHYDIFSETPFHGGNELDISGMLTYTVGDKWLKLGGTLVFVITQTHFQSPSSQGFRSFSIGKKANLVPVNVDDLKNLKPFPQATNRTAIMRLKKVKSNVLPAYPVPYKVWEKASESSAAIPDNLTKNEVLKRVEIGNWEANPVGEEKSPWAILPRGRFKDMESIRNGADWVAGRKGVTVDLNGIYMVRMIDVNREEGLVQIETRPEAGRTNIGPARKFWVEPDLLYPLLKGAADFSACDLHIKEQLYVFVPNTGINKASCDAAVASVSALKKTTDFFKRYKELLEQRSTYRLRQGDAPYYAIYNVGDYTFSPYKVVWAEMSSAFKATVVESGKVPLVGKRIYVPDHKIYFANFQDRGIAHFVCGLLNSGLVREYLASHLIKISVGNIFKHLKLPEFSPDDNRHNELFRLSLAAHKTTNHERKATLLAEMSELAEFILTDGF